MELKKTPKADLQNKKPIFALVGLLAALLIAVGAFSWNKGEVKFNDVGVVGEVVEQQIVEITRPDEPKPEIAKVATPAAASNVLEAVDNSVKLDANMDMFNIEANENTVINLKPASTHVEESLEEDVIVLRAEKMPTFRGGDVKAFNGWVQKNTRYPAVAEQNNITGRVIALCVIGRDGVIRDVQMLSAPDPSLFEAVKETLLSAPKFTPGEQRGKPVAVRIQIIVNFQTTN